MLRVKSSKLNLILEKINSTSFGLTLDIHSYLKNRAKHIIERGKVSKLYVNRNMIGAVVGGYCLPLPVLIICIVLPLNKHIQSALRR